MNKNKFLEELEKKLYVLSEDERKDIVNEYRDIIEEKVKHGKTEKEAIEEFGDTNELVKEILKAYKINVDFDKKDTTFKDVAEKSEDFIKKSAKKLSNFTKEIIEKIKEEEGTEEVNADVIFEVVIKSILLLFGLLLLKIPFYIIEQIGKEIIGNNIFPLQGLSFIWGFIVWILYIVACIMIFVITFSSLLKGSNKEKKVNEKEVEKKTETKKTSEKVETNVVSVKKKEGNAAKIVILILKIFLIFTFFIPIISFMFGWSIVVAIAIYLAIKGVEVAGILILSAGIFMICGSILKFIINLFKDSKALGFSNFIIGFILIITGLMLTIDEASKFKYIDEIPSTFKIETYEKEYEVSGDLNVTSFDGIDVVKMIDETMEDNIIILEYDCYENGTCVLFDKDGKELEIEKKYTGDRYEFSMMRSIVEQLKERKIHNYSNLYENEIIIRGNSETLSRIKI